jgi:hypothetical protein
MRDSAIPRHPNDERVYGANVAVEFARLFRDAWVAVSVGGAVYALLWVLG